MTSTPSPEQARSSCCGAPVIKDLNGFTHTGAYYCEKCTHICDIASEDITKKMDEAGAGKVIRELAKHDTSVQKPEEETMKKFTIAMCYVRDIVDNNLNNWDEEHLDHIEEAFKQMHKENKELKAKLNEYETA